MTKWTREYKRVWIDLVLFILILAVFQTDLYEKTTAPIQLFMLKMLLINAGLLHAHIVGKHVFKTKIDWSITLMKQSGAYYARVLLYIAIPVCYAFGG